MPASERASLAVFRLQRQNCCMFTPGTDRDVVPNGAVVTNARNCAMPSSASASGMPEIWRGN
ncbi:hypothetical protein D3C71_1617250 [compost metagenome]